MKRILIIIWGILLLTTVHAQDVKFTQGLGFSAGTISGSGFSYRKINDKVGFQITLGMGVFRNDEQDYSYFSFSESYNGNYNPKYWTPDTSKVITEKDLSGNSGSGGDVGLTFYKPLHKSKKSLFYTMVGVSYYYSSEIIKSKDYKYFLTSDSTYSYEPISNINKSKEIDHQIFTGFGLGIEYKYTDNVRISIELPLTFSSKGEIFMYIPQGGIHYYYK